MNKLVKKHDLLAKKFLTDTTIAKEFVLTYLDPKLLAKIDLNSLQIEPSSYIEEELTAYYSDLVYRFKLKENDEVLYLYNLIEHQSRAEELMPFRILRYQVFIIQKYLDEFKSSTKLPIVASLVFYNGKKSPYPYSLDIAELFADKIAYTQASLGKFRLVDLTIIEDSELLQHGKLALLEILLKHISKRDFSNIIKLIIDAFKVSLHSNIDNSLLNSAFSYLINAK